MQPVVTVTSASRIVARATSEGPYLFGVISKLPHAIVLEDPDPTHPVGAKEIGEPSLVGAAPAIANAICNATGARVRAFPMTPKRVLDALEARS